MSCNTCLTLCRSYWSQHKKPSPREWQLLLELNSLTCTELTPKLIQVNGCLCPCFGFQICCEAPQYFWKLLETTNCWKPGHKWYLLLIHVPLCLVMYHISEDTVFIGYPRGPWWVTFCSIAFCNTGVSQVMKNPIFLLPQYSSLSSSSAYPTTNKMCWLFANSFVLLPWDTQFRAEKAHFLQTRIQFRKIKKYWSGSFKTVKKTLRPAAGVTPEGFFFRL